MSSLNKTRADQVYFGWGLKTYGTEKELAVDYDTLRTVFRNQHPVDVTGFVGGGDTGDLPTLTTEYGLSFLVTGTVGGAIPAKGGTTYTPSAGSIIQWQEDIGGNGFVTIVAGVGGFPPAGTRAVCVGGSVISELGIVRVTKVTYDAHLGTLNFGDSVTGSLSSATAWVIKDDPVDASNGVLYLAMNNLTSFQDNDVILASVGNSATATATITEHVCTNEILEWGGTKITPKYMSWETPDFDMPYGSTFGMVNGSVFMVRGEGSLYKNGAFVFDKGAEVDPDVTGANLGDWVLFSGAGQLTAGDAISIASSVVSAKYDAMTLGLRSDGLTGDLKVREEYSDLSFQGQSGLGELPGPFPCVFLINVFPDAPKTVVEDFESGETVAGGGFSGKFAGFAYTERFGADMTGELWMLFKDWNGVEPSGATTLLGATSGSVAEVKDSPPQCIDNAPDGTRSLFMIASPYLFSDNSFGLIRNGQWQTRVYHADEANRSPNSFWINPRSHVVFEYTQTAGIFAVVNPGMVLEVHNGSGTPTGTGEGVIVGRFEDKLLVAMTSGVFASADPIQDKASPYGGPGGIYGTCDADGRLIAAVDIGASYAPDVTEDVEYLSFKRALEQGEDETTWTGDVNE